VARWDLTTRLIVIIRRVDRVDDSPEAKDNKPRAGVERQDHLCVGGHGLADYHDQDNKTEVQLIQESP